MKHRIITIFCSAILFMNGAATLAQQSDEGKPSETTPPPPDNTASSESSNQAEPAASTKSVEPAGKQCVPDCRSGFLCHRGICVSACNPPCATGFQCSAIAQCEALPPTATPLGTLPHADKTAARNKRRLEKLAFRKQYRKIPRISFSTSGAFGFLKDGDALEASFHIGLGFRKNIVEQFGLIARANLIVGVWEDDSIPSIELDYGADTATKVIGFDAEVFPYMGPFGRFYMGPVIGLRGMYPHKKRIVVDVDPYYGRDRVIHFEDTLFLNYGFGAGVLIGPKESINVNGRIMSSMTQRMPLYLQVGVAYDFPIRGND